jgi:hypothetical protein
MDGDQPFIKQMQDKIPSREDLQNGMSERVKSMGESMSGMKEGLKASLDEFSSKSNQSFSEASAEFLNSNSLLAKFSFIILVVIIFMILLKLFMSIIALFLTPSENPYIVKGALGGNDRVLITQDPLKDTTIQVLKSNDRSRGLEFTWCVWLYLTVSPDEQHKMKNIFVKGDENFGPVDHRTEYNLTNGPGLYLKSNSPNDTSVNINEYELFVVMDNLGSSEEKSRETVSIGSIPINKWVHVAIRMQNTVLDTYVNGTLAKRLNMEFVPKQNFNDITVCANGGFPGKLSDLRYFSHALNVFEINNVVMFGPNTTPSTLSVDSAARTGTYSYLASSWYTQKYNATT